MMRWEMRCVCYAAETKIYSFIYSLPQMYYYYNKEAIFVKQKKPLFIFRGNFFLDKR